MRGLSSSTDSQKTRMRGSPGREVLLFGRANSVRDIAADTTNGGVAYSTKAGLLPWCGN